MVCAQIKEHTVSLPCDRVDKVILDWLANKYL